MLAASAQQILHWRLAFPFPGRESQCWLHAVWASETAVFSPARKPQVFFGGHSGCTAAAYDADSSAATDINIVLYTRGDLILTNKAGNLHSVQLVLGAGTKVRSVRVGRSSLQNWQCLQFNDGRGDELPGFYTQIPP